MKNKGFTLVELLVSSGIFSIIIIVTVGVFTSAIKLQDNVLSAKKVIGELNYALEFMSRNLRMAVKDRIGGDCITIPKTSYEILEYDEGIKFKNVFESGQCQQIFLENKQIKFKKGNDTPLELTSPGIKINSLQFSVSGNLPDDSLQPLVTIYLEATSGKSTPIKLQTSVSQRNLDVNY